MCGVEPPYFPDYEVLLPRSASGRQTVMRFRVMCRHIAHAGRRCYFLADFCGLVGLPTFTFFPAFAPCGFCTLGDILAP